MAKKTEKKMGVNVGARMNRGRRECVFKFVDVADFGEFEIQICFNGSVARETAEQFAAMLCCFPVMVAGFPSMIGMTENFQRMLKSYENASKVVKLATENGWKRKQKELKAEGLKPTAH